MRMVKQNRFDTLNEALDSEGLLDTWKIEFPPLQYNQTFSYNYEDGTKYGRHVSVTRFEDGTYERPIHYNR